MNPASWITTKALGYVIAALVLALAATWGWGQLQVAEARLETASVRAELAAYRAGIAEQRERFEAAARDAERRQAEQLNAATDAARERESRIEQDYERRIAGLDAERDRLRAHWGSCETNRLAAAAGSAAAGALAEADGLRRAGAARIVRAVEKAQSERDEAIDRYNAVYEAFEAFKLSLGEAPS